MWRILRIFAALLLLVFADLVVVAFSSLVCLGAAWVSLVHTPTSSVLRVLFSDPIALVSQARQAPNDLGMVIFSIGFGAAAVFCGLVVATFRDLIASGTRLVRPAFLALLIRGLLLTVFVPLGAITGVWAARLIAVDPTLRSLFFIVGGVVGFGVVVLFFFAFEVAGKPRMQGVLRGRVRNDRHA